MADPFQASTLEEFRLTADGDVEARVRTSSRAPWGPWEARSRRSLLAYPLASPLWKWLRKHGVRRAKPSGPTRSHAEQRAKGRVRVDVYLSAEAAEALAREAAVHGTNAAALEAILTRAKK